MRCHHCVVSKIKIVMDRICIYPYYDENIISFGRNEIFFLNSTIIYDIKSCENQNVHGNWHTLQALICPALGGQIDFENLA